MSISRRDVLKYAAAAPAVLGLGGTLAAVSAGAGTPSASAAPLGVLLDYAAGVIKATDLRASGAAGAIRYVSDRRPGGAWMLGKPIQLPEARDLYQSGLKIVSCYQFGKQDSADWLGGQNAGVQHAKRGWQLHVAAGGSYGAPIYASIDDDPSYEQYKQQVAPYLKAWEAVLGHQRVGVYANSKTIDWALQDGIGTYFWQHNWGSPKGFTHPAAHLHQVEIDKRSVGGVGVDLNNILKSRFGQWD
jgi:glycoside hydrolase-like protein/TAT (twin-arginine translocation) pathway-exported protein